MGAPYKYDISRLRVKDWELFLMLQRGYLRDHGHVLKFDPSTPKRDDQRTFTICYITLNVGWSVVRC